MRWWGALASACGLLTLFQLRPPPNSQSPIWPLDDPPSDRILNQLALRPPPRKDRISIYLPQGFGGWPGVRRDGDLFLAEECPLNNCRLVEVPTDAPLDAVIFRQYASQSLVNSTMEFRHPDQVWIYFSLEPPTYASLDPVAVRGMFNWTATYRRDSDIVTPYDYFLPWDTLPPQHGEIVPTTTHDYSRGKTKMGAWFVSHCDTASGRENYVRELQKFIPVDIYGGCGPLRCKRSSRRCDKKLDQDYRFYLAFENSRCKDYVTEKLFLHGLRRNVIPVVLGAPKADYLRIAPEGSFIHVDDFASPAHLADHLLHLANNPAAYNQYFRWKNTGRFVDSRFWCRLCALLNLPPSARRIADLATWWQTDAGCRKPL